MDEADTQLPFPMTISPQKAERLMERVKKFAGPHPLGDIIFGQDDFGVIVTIRCAVEVEGERVWSRRVISWRLLDGLVEKDFNMVVAGHVGFMVRELTRALHESWEREHDLR